MINISYQYLLEIDCLNASNVAITSRFCCLPGFSGGGYTWEPRIVDPGLLQVNLFSGDKVTGRSSYSFGEIVLGNFKNVDDLTGPTDYLKDYKFYGGAVRMYMGLATASWPAGFTQQFVGIIESCSIGDDIVSFTWRGRQAELDIPFNGGKFLGDNVAPGGYEGDASLQGKSKPIILGRCFNVPVTLCNASKLIYAVSPLTGISTINELNSGIRVFDNGIELFSMETLSSVNALINSTIPCRPGQYRGSSDGYIQLGSTPAGQVTVSCASRGMALIAHPKNLITQLFTLADAVPGRTHANFSDMIDASTFTDFDDTFERGVYISDNTNISDIIDRIVAPCGYWYFTLLGKLRVRNFQLTGYGTAAYTAQSDINIMSCRFRKTSDTKGGVPASKVTFNCARNYTVQSTLAGGADPKHQQRVSVADLQYTVPSTGFVYPLSAELVIDTWLTGSTYFDRGAYHLGETARDMLCLTHDLCDISIIKSDFLTVKDIAPGDVISLDLKGRFGYTGSDMLVVGKTINYTDETVNFTLWKISGT